MNDTLPAKAGQAIQAVIAMAAVAAIVVSTCALTSSRDAFERSERPWVYVDISLGDSPLEIKPDGTASLALAASLRNVGKSVAIEAHMHAELIFYPQRDDGGGGRVSFQAETVEKVQGAACDRAREQASSKLNLKHAIFPGESVPAVPVVDTTGHPLPLDQSGEIMVVGCIDYLSAIDPASAHHRTPFSYVLMSKAGWLRTQVGVVPREQLRLEKSPMQGHINPN